MKIIKSLLVLLMLLTSKVKIAYKYLVMIDGTYVSQCLATANFYRVFSVVVQE